MIYKIAIASSDGVKVDSHFGAADRFYIVELDSEKEDCETVGSIEVEHACRDGGHVTESFEAVLGALEGVSAIIAQRVGPGARKFIRERGVSVYEIPLEIEQALCLLLEEKQWEADKWQSHTKN